MKPEELRHVLAAGFHARPALLYAPCADQISLAHVLAVEDDAGDEPSYIELCAAAFGMREITRDKPFLFSEGMAFIPIHGALINRWPHSAYGYTGYQFIRNQFDAALADPDVKGIVFDVNSYGGMVYGNFELAEHIRSNRGAKPSMALVDAMAFSGGYSLASAAGSIVISPSGDVGSIGVVTVHVDQSKMLKDWGLKVTMIYAGKHKVDGNPYEPLSDDVRADMQSGIDESYQEFVVLVSNNRGMTEKAVRDTEARIYGSNPAKSIGLVDAVLTPTEAVAAFRSELSGSTSAKWRTRNMSTATSAADAAKTPPATPAVAATPPAAEPAAASVTPDVVAAPAQIDDAAGAERKRVSSILGCAEARGRDLLAKHFALSTGLSFEDAKAALATAPVSAATASDKTRFDAAMEHGNPNVSAGDGGAPAEPGLDKTKAIVAAYQKATGRKPYEAPTAKHH